MSHAAESGLPDYGWASEQAEQSHGYLQPVVLRAIDAVDRARTDRMRPLRVFDAGCGNGALLRLLIERGYVAAGCDGSESGVRHARRACRDAIHIEHLSVYEELIDVFGGSWDVVVSTEVIEHLFTPRRFVTEAARLLAPTGALVLSTPYHGYLKNLALAASGGMDRHFTALWDGGHIKFWSYRTLRELLRESGFEDFEFRGAGRLTWLWKSMVVTARKRS